MPRRPRARRPALSVRVRVCLAATLVTTVWLGLGGWSLLRVVEALQTAQLRDCARDQVEDVGRRVAAGEAPSDAVAAAGDEGCGRADARSTGDEVVGPVTGDVGAGDVGAGADEVIGSGGEGSQVMPRDGLDGQAYPPIQVSGADAEVYSAVVPTSGGDVAVQSASWRSEVDRTVRAVRQALVLGAPVVVLAVAALSWWLVGRSLRPVEAIRLRTEAIGGSTLHQRVPEPGGRDELDRLARTMNAMLARVEAGARRERQFVADASHELRSPLSVIRTEVEVALDEGEGADWPSVGRSVLTEEARLEVLLADLLELARGDEAARPDGAPVGRPVDLLDLSRGEAARARCRPVVVEGEPGTTVSGVRAELERVLANLLDNAARHARSEVRVLVASAGDTVELVVDDDGEGIPEADRERVFERFTRLDDGRGREQGGTGLGLAVVRTLVARHGGTVRAGTSPSGGARFCVALPRQGVALPRQAPPPAVPRQQHDRPLPE